MRVVPIQSAQSHMLVRGTLTGSSCLPINTLSVVACTLPLFRCRSHMISLRFSCGNICDICSTCAAVKRRPLRGADEELDEEEREAKNHL